MIIFQVISDVRKGKLVVGIARATIISIDEIELQEIGLHNHTAPYHSRPTSVIRAEVKAFVGRKGGTASQIRNEFISQKGAELN